MNLAAVIIVIEEVIKLLATYGPGLVSLGLNLLPLIAKIKDAIDALFNGGVITDAQRDELHRTTAELENQWAAVVASATTSGGTTTS